MAEAMAEVRMSWFVHVHKFVAQHTTQFTGVENLQDALGTADGRVPFVAPGGEGVGLMVGAM